MKLSHIMMDSEAFYMWKGVSVCFFPTLLPTTKKKTTRRQTWSIQIL